MKGTVDIAANAWRYHYKWHTKLRFWDRIKVLFGFPISIYGAGELASKYWVKPAEETMLIRIEIFINDNEETTGRKG